MFKTLFVGVWVAVVLTATSMVSSGKLDSLMGGNGADGKPDIKVETAKLDPISVSLIRDGKVIGYLILETAFTYPAKSKAAKLPMNMIFQDAIVDLVFSDQEIDVDRLDKFDLEQFRKRLKERVDSQVGFDVVQSVMIQRIDYLTLKDVRDNKLRNFAE